MRPEAAPEILCPLHAPIRRHIGKILVVVDAGAHNHWRQTGASGTAAQILESLTCDLLVVRPPGYVSPLLVTED
jgi:hypothetical protein